MIYIKARRYSESMVKLLHILVSLLKFWRKPNSNINTRGKANIIFQTTYL